VFSLGLVVAAAGALGLAAAAPSATVAFPPAIGGYEYKACFEKFPQTGVIDREGFYLNSYVANGQPSNMGMGSRWDNYHCLVGNPLHFGNVRFTVNVFAMANGALGAPLAGYEVEMQALFPKFIVEGPRAGRVGTPFATEAQIYTDPSSALPWFASVVAGALPPGLRVAGNGRISGVPLKAGVYSFTLQYTTPVVPWQNAARPRYAVALTIAKPLAVVPDALRPATVGRLYRARLAGVRGDAPYTFVRLAGALPRGLRLSRTGSISGVPTRAGTYRFVIAVRDSAGVRGRDAVLLKVRRDR
jgi:hypothetical protein